MEAKQYLGKTRNSHVRFYFRGSNATGMRRIADIQLLILLKEPTLSIYRQIIVSQGVLTACGASISNCNIGELHSSFTFLA